MRRLNERWRVVVAAGGVLLLTAVLVAGMFAAFTTNPAADKPSPDVQLFQSKQVVRTVMGGNPGMVIDVRDCDWGRCVYTVRFSGLAAVELYGYELEPVNGGTSR